MPGSIYIYVCIYIYINCLMVASFFVGLGPGGLKKEFTGQVEEVPYNCLPGSNHGGSVPPTGGNLFQVGDPYDKENLKTFRGGSGGDAIYSIPVLLFLLPVFLTSLPRRRSKMAETSQISRYHNLRNLNGIKTYLGNLLIRGTLKSENKNKQKSEPSNAHDAKLSEFSLYLCGPNSMTRANAQIDVGIYGTVLYPVTNYILVQFLSWINKGYKNLLTVIGICRISFSNTCG